MTDYTKAAIRAAETLIRYGVKSTPVSPLQILEQLDNVVTVSFSEISESCGIGRGDLLQTFGKSLDAITSVHTENGRPFYMVAYNRLLPMPMIQRAMARELGHIILRHDGSSPENTEEAFCFACHFLCPRPLIHAIQATGMRVTTDMLANLTGIFDQDLVKMRRIPGTDVPAMCC